MVQIYVNNALAKPKAINIYLGEQWLTKKIGKIYNAGLWNDFIKYSQEIYNYGNESYPLEGYPSYSTINRITDRLEIPSANDSERGVVSNNPIDLTDYSTLFIEWDNGTAPSLTNNSLFVRTDKLLNSSFAARKNITGNITKSVASVDITSLSGMYYVGAFCRVASSATYRLSIYRIWLE